MADVIRRTPEEVKPCVDAGDTLLVCAYDNSDKFTEYRLEGAIALSELRTKEQTLAPDKDIVFYCA